MAQTHLLRRRFLKSSLAATASLALVGRGWAAPSEQVNVAVIGIGGRGRGLLREALRVPGVKVTHLVDADINHAKRGLKQVPDAKAHQDLRRALDDKEVDAVIIATCNHWHCLAGIWACQAGKHVYVEKPLGHNIAEQRRLVEASLKHDRLVQVGTQQRTDPVQAEIKQFLHGEKALGEVKYIRANRYGRRGPIGKQSAPIKIPESIDYNLWCGPADQVDIFRKQLHYDWHWDWNTGNGEMGNWGTHIIDDLRNVGLLDKVALPKRILAGGGRVLWDDAGTTPNVHFTYYDTGSVPVLFDLSNLTRAPGVKMERRHLSIGSGYTVVCEGGRYSGGRGGGAAFDNDNKRIRKFSGNAGRGHMANFFEAVRAGKREMLTADVEQGHYSSAWCELANIGWRCATTCEPGAAMEINQADKHWQELVAETEEHLAAHQVEMKVPEILVGPVLELDVEAERFVGAHADKANALIGRKGRAGFEIPVV